MILLIIIFVTIILSSQKDKYEFALSRKKGKKLPRNGEYEEVIARYVNGR